MQKYLNYIKNKYSDFRYFSDKNILENLDLYEDIDYKIISNDIWFCIVFLDNRISNKIYFFWFLEIYKQQDFTIFLDEVKQYCKDNNANKLVWPINLSIWNTYRFCKDDKEKFILWEYDTNKDINILLLKNNFQIYEKYITAKRTWENPYILKKSYNNFEIQKVQIDKQSLKNIFDLLVQIFSKAPEINFKEFESYMKIYIDLYKNNINIFFLRYNWKNIWFLSSFYTEKYFVIKTIWILAEFRSKGLANFLLSYVYDYYYLEQWLDESYYLYMKEEGNALNMTNKNAEIFREYFTYYINI